MIALENRDVCREALLAVAAKWLERKRLGAWCGHTESEAGKGAAGKLRQCLLLSAYYDLYCQEIACEGMEAQVAQHFQELLAFPAAALQLLFCFINPGSNLLAATNTSHVAVPLHCLPDSDPDFTQTTWYLPYIPEVGWQDQDDDNGDWSGIAVPRAER